MEPTDLGKHRPLPLRLLSWPLRISLAVLAVPLIAACELMEKATALVDPDSTHHFVPHPSRHHGYCMRCGVHYQHHWENRS